MSQIKDERINAQVHRYGYEAFNLVCIIIGGKMIIQTFILNLNISQLHEYILLLVAGGYFIIRCALGGALYVSVKPKDRSKFTRNLLLITVCSVIFGAVIAVRNTFLYSGGKYLPVALPIVVISAVSMFIMSAALWAMVYGVSKWQENKHKDE